MLICYASIFNRTGGMDMAFIMALGILSIIHTLLNIVLTIFNFEKGLNSKYQIVRIFIPPILFCLILYFNKPFFYLMSWFK